MSDHEYSTVSDHKYKDEVIKENAEKIQQQVLLMSRQHDWIKGRKAEEEAKNKQLLAGVRNAGMIVGSLLDGATSNEIENDYILSRIFSELRAAYFKASGSPLQWLPTEYDELEQEWLEKLAN